MLEPEYEKNLWQLCTHGDLKAREELIVAYRPLVFWIAGKIHVLNNNIELKQDMIQEGMLALIKAVDKFDPEKGFKFTTFAYHKIHGQIINLLERSERKAPIPVPDEWLQVDTGINSHSEEYSDDEDWIDVSQSIAKLKGREADVVNALFFEGKKPQDVALEQKLDVSHVYRLRRSAIVKIRHWLGLDQLVTDGGV